MMEVTKWKKEQIQRQEKRQGGKYPWSIEFLTCTYWTSDLALLTQLLVHLHLVIIIHFLYFAQSVQTCSTTVFPGRWSIVEPVGVFWELEYASSLAFREGTYENNQTVDVKFGTNSWETKAEWTLMLIDMPKWTTALVNPDISGEGSICDFNNIRVSTKALVVL